MTQQVSDVKLCVSVCQETVWEAFRIFWDRLPERDEYQHWVGGCVSGAVGIGDVGRFFSQSEEHKELIRTVSQRWLCLYLDDDDDDDDDDDVFLSESFHGSSRESVSSKRVIVTKRVSSLFHASYLPPLSMVVCFRVNWVVLTLLLWCVVCFFTCCRAAVTTDPPPCRYDPGRQHGPAPPSQYCCFFNRLYSEKLLNLDFDRKRAAFGS